MPPWSNALGGGPGMPAQPIHDPCPACTMGASALTKPAWAHFPRAVVGTDDREAVRDDDDLVGRGRPRAHRPTVAPPPPRGRRAGCLCVTPCGSVSPMTARRILASGAAALLVLIVLAIVTHDDGRTKDVPRRRPPPTAPGHLRVACRGRQRHARRRRARCDEKKAIESAAATRFGGDNVVSHLKVLASRRLRALARDVMEALPRKGSGFGAIDIVSTKKALTVSGKRADRGRRATRCSRPSTTRRAARSRTSSRSSARAPAARCRRASTMR